jgi:hypothetical protein
MDQVKESNTSTRLSSQTRSEPLTRKLASSLQLASKLIVSYACCSSTDLRPMSRTAH